MKNLRLLNLEIEKAWQEHCNTPEVQHAHKVLAGCDANQFQILKMIWTISYLKNKLIKE
jgi:hypothetical protein